MTPTELVTQQYMGFVQQEADEFTEENKKAMLESAAIILALYLGRSKNSGYDFLFTKAVDPIFESLKKLLFDNFEKYSNNGIRLSQLKNNQILNKIIKTPIVDNWLTRKVGDFTLKQRIARYTQMFRMELESRVAMAITNGEKQDFVIRSISRYLENPYDFIDPAERYKWASNRLARKYNPGSGRYKSAYKNFKRLAYSEIIEVYRRADHVIWKADKSIKGVLVYENPRHPKYDMCDELWGLYSKYYIFTGFHPECICLAIPITNGKSINGIPQSAKDYMNQEKPRKWWGKLPFITENLKYWE